MATAVSSFATHSTSFMKKLSEIILDVLDNSVTNAALRFSVRGLGSQICKSMIEARSHTGVGTNVGAGATGDIRSHSLLLWIADGTEGDSWPLPTGLKSGSLKTGQLISARNLSGFTFVTLYPSGGAASDSQIQAETELTDVLDKVEKYFFNELGYQGGVPGWYPKHCIKLLESSNLRRRWDIRSLSEVRWKILESIDNLIRIHNKHPQYAFAAVIGVPTEPAEGSHVSKENITIAERLADFMSNGRSRAAAMQQFEGVIATPGIFENPEEVRNSLNDFFDWLVSTDYDSEDWKEVYAIYGLRSLEDPDRFDESWRQVLNRDVWEKLLGNYRKLKKVSIEVNEGISPFQKIQPYYIGDEEIYLVKDMFGLSLLNDGEPHPAYWNFFTKTNKQFTSELADSPSYFNIEDETDLKIIFNSKIRVTPKVDGAVTKKGPSLLCIHRYEFGLFLLSQEAKSIEQPKKFTDGRADAVLTLAAAGEANVKLCYWNAKYRIESVQLDGTDVSFLDDGITVGVTVQNNNEEQSLIFSLTQGSVRLAVEVIIVPAEISLGKYKSYVHNLAAMHIKQKKLPLNISVSGGEERMKLLAAVMESEHGWPAAIMIGESLAPFVEVAAAFHICISQDTAFRKFLTSKHTGWALPLDIISKRRALWNAFKLASAGNSPEQTDFTSPILLRAGEDYLESFNSWYIQDATAALRALEAMDSVVVYDGINGDYTRIQYIQLPLHPVRLRGLLGLYHLLREEDTHEGYRMWHPPLSRLCSMVGPRFWSIHRLTGKELYQINSATSPYYPVYTYLGAAPAVVDASNIYLHKEFKCSGHQSSLSLSSSDVPQLMNDICTLNSSLSQLKVYLQSDPMGKVSDGLIDWYVGTGNDDDSLGNIYDDWVDVAPLSLSVFSNSKIIENNEIDGKVASCADIPGRKLIWSRTKNDSPAGYRFNAAIIAEISPIKDNDTPADGMAKPQAINLHRIGCEWRLEYKLTGTVHAETFGSRGLIGSFNGVSAVDKAFIPGLIDSWSEQVATARKNFNYRMGELAACVNHSQFVALPVSSNSGILAAAGLGEGSAVWKYKQGGFESADGGSGHIILTKELDLLAGRFDRILRRAGLIISNDEQKAVMTAMGRAGLNTLHHLSDNEQSLLGAVSSVAVMRAYPKLVSPVEGVWPVMVLPLDPFEEQFTQLKSIKRPDFLCFSIKPEGNSFSVVITVLEAKWRKTRLEDSDLADMLADQCCTFQDRTFERFTPSVDSLQRKISSAVLLSEMLTCAIRLFSANNPDRTDFSPDKSAQKCSELIDALFNGRCTVKWGRHMLAVVSHEQSSELTDYSKGDLLRLSLSDCIGLLRDPSFAIDFSKQIPSPVDSDSTSTQPSIPLVEGKPIEPVQPSTVAPLTPPVADRENPSSGTMPPPPPPPPPMPSKENSGPDVRPVSTVDTRPAANTNLPTEPKPSNIGLKFNSNGVRVISIRIGETF